MSDHHLLCSFKPAVPNFASRCDSECASYGDNIDTPYIIRQSDCLWKTNSLASIALDYCTLLHLYPAELHFRMFAK